MAIIKDGRVCIECLKEHLRIPSGYNSSGRKRYRDEFGLMWHGKMCGVCNRRRAAWTMQNPKPKQPDGI